jgi:hypothetical protein
MITSRNVVIGQLVTIPHIAINDLFRRKDGDITEERDTKRTFE